MRFRAAALAVGAWATLATGSIGAQSGSAPPATTQPPVLSTTPTPPPGAQTEPSQMSGMPLQVGDLPPGTVAVRVIRRTFEQNVVNVPVELRVGTASTARSSVTDPEGRAVFPGLRVGDVVRTKAVVDGEALESQSFQLPTQGGVRLVLVAGVGASVPTSQVQTFEAATGGTGVPAAASAGSPPPPGPAAVSGGEASTTLAAPAAKSSGEESTPIGPLSITASLLLAAAAGGFWWLRGSSRRTREAACLDAEPHMVARGAEPNGADSREPRMDDARERLFRELMTLDGEHPGSSDTVDYRRRRQALIDAIVRLDGSR